MNHIALRRFALAAASVSLGTLTALVLIGSTIVGNAQSLQDNASETALQDQLESVPISCTPLVIQELAAYDGKFIEDGSDREVENVAAIMLHNSANRMIPYAYVTVYTENCQFTFNAYMIPPKSTVLVPEQTGQILKESEIVRVFGWTTVKEEREEPRLEIEEVGMGCLSITNRSGSKLHNLTIYHRTYIPDGCFYMGGRVFKTEVPYIAPGNTVFVYPENYASGYSEVIFYEQSK